MNSYVTFQISGVLSSWGTVAIGDVRPSQDHPTRSAILGLIAGTLGYTRDSKNLETLEDIKVAVCVLSSGSFLRDYHTVQVGEGKKYRDLPTRTQELTAQKRGDIGTKLTYRDYRADADYVVLLKIREEFKAKEILKHLQEPVFSPFLGRKSCPPSLPFAPLYSEGNDSKAVLSEYINFLKSCDSNRFKAESSRKSEFKKNIALFWEEGIEGFDFREKRLVRDKVLNRKRWQFSNRFEYCGFLKEEDADALLN